MAESANSLLQYAINKGKMDADASTSGRIANTLNKLLAGGLQGREDAKAEHAAQFERQSRILDHQKKLQEMQFAAENQRIARNIAKRTGLLPLEPNEKDVVRGAALEDLASKNPATDTSSAGRIASMMIGGNEYDPVPGWSQKGGVTLDLQRTDKGSDAARAKAEADARELREKAIKLATEAARRDKYNQISTLITDPTEATTFANVQPSQDEIEKYIPESIAYLKGDDAGTQSSRRKRTSTDSMVGEGLQEMQARIQSLRSASEDYRPFNEDPVEIDKLTARRNQILNGGGTGALRQQYTEEISSLSEKKNKKGKLSPDETERLKTLGRRLIQMREFGG